MVLAVDIGNTRIKAAVFERNTLVKHFAFDNFDVENIYHVLSEFPAVSDIVVASVGDDVSKLFADVSIKTHIISNKSRFPFENQYETPSTLGIDRMVLASGAVFGFPKQNRLVIDAGTCITYDFIDSADKYLGGAISPGIRLRYEALHNFTSRLPLLSTEIPEHFVGKSTSQSIHSGVVNGIVNEIEGFITLYRVEYPNFIIILTGGDTEFLANRLKNTIFANSNFLIESLNQTFQFQSTND